MEKATRDQANVDLLGHSYDTFDCKAKKLHKFSGTNNPRHIRVIFRLLKGSIPREILDRVAGCSNGPDLTAELRRRGLEIPCQRIPAYDRDGELIRHGVYSLSIHDRKLIHRWLASRNKGGEK
jgi:hypothetical protein